ncbi:MAG: hypothetical protein K2O94_00420, partial [Clostridiales bacterium]|nr:hypothetical protein [Clostridiales bacterium]
YLIFGKNEALKFHIHGSSVSKIKNYHDYITPKIIMQLFDDNLTIFVEKYCRFSQQNTPPSAPCNGYDNDVRNKFQNK